jgi:hypothetical protein
LSYGQEIGAAREGESGNAVQLIEKRYRDGDDNQRHHERGLPPVDALQQLVQSQGHEDKTCLADQFAGNPEAKERLRGQDVAGRRPCVSVHDHLAGNIDDGEKAEDGREQIQ